MIRDSLILRPFNSVFWGTFLVFALLFAVLSLVLRRRQEAVRRRALTVLMLFTLAAFVVYKLLLSRDADYSALCAAAGKGAFNWWAELPLQLCNINTILIPIAMWTKRRPLEGFCFFTAPLGAAMALLMPVVGFSGFSLLMPRMLGYYFTHFMVFFGGLALWSFGIYRPVFSDLPRVLLSAFCLCTGIFCINMLMRITGVNPYANYFYCVDPQGNPILSLLFRYIPIPFVYVLPCALVLTVYMLAVTALLRPKKKDR